MLSILIPVFNQNVHNLVQDLNKQVEKASVLVEIIIVDDASTNSKIENENLRSLENVYFEKLENNIGRSKIRNYLASLAKYDNLLFIDCDAKVKNVSFIQNYINCIQQNHDVVCGGLEYEKSKPQNADLFFRWYYGIKRECRDLSDRVQEPYKSFSSFNFFIKKSIFETIKFDENLLTYGHEDTLFGIKLQQQKVNILHINNPLMHDGLENAKLFIKKTNQSIQNLKYLNEHYSKQYALAKSIKLIKYVKIINGIRMSWLFKLFNKLFSKSLINNITSNKPSLLKFDFYKICYYYSLK